VVAVSRTQSDLDTLAQEVGNGLKCVCVDLSDWQATRDSLREAVRGVHCLVNNAAVAHLEPFLAVSEHNFDKYYLIFF